MTITRTIAAALVLLAVAGADGLAQDMDYGKKDMKPQETEAERKARGTSLFARYDKDRNNTLKGEETPKNWVRLYDLNGDDKVAKKEFLEIWMRPAWKGATPLRHPRARAQNALTRFDRDKNGEVSMEEYPGADHAFKKADRDKDGVLVWKELLRLAKTELEDIRKKMKSPNRYDMLNLFDINGDRQITKAEYDGPTKAFQKYDANDDGTVSYYEIYPQRMPANMEAMKPKPELQNVLKSMDTNDDGRISREEWKGSDAGWKRMDKNRDGWISGADAN